MNSFDPEDSAFAEHDDELGFAPEPDELRTVAPDEPFRPDMILIPVICGVCKLRMYAQEKHVGDWMACPDCTRLNEIRPVDPLLKCVVTLTEAGTLELRALADRTPNPVMRTGVDYREVTGSLDVGAEAIPFYGLNESSEDEVENFIDRLIEKKSDVRSVAEKKYHQLADTAKQKRSVEKEESPAVRQQRLLGELEKRKGITSKEPLLGGTRSEPLPENLTEAELAAIRSPRAADGPPASDRIASGGDASDPNLSADGQKQPSVGSGYRVAPLPKGNTGEITQNQMVEKSEPPPQKTDVTDVSAAPNSSDTQNSPSVLPPSVAKKKKSLRNATDDRPWRYFFHPFFDPANARRFMFLGLTGFIAMVMLLNLYYYMVQVTEPGSDTPFLFLLFYSQYILTFCPMALWGTALLLGGMTIFLETKDGSSLFRRWIPFRVEFASHYLFWFFIVSWVAPFLGTLTAILLYWCGISVVWLGIEWIQIRILGSVSLFFFGPVLLLSLAENDCGFAPYHRTIWGSVIRRPLLWLIYYVVSAILFAVIGAMGIGLFFFTSFTFQKNWFLMAPLSLLAGIIFCTILTTVIFVWFRLLGCVAWTIASAPQK